MNNFEPWSTAAYDFRVQVSTFWKRRMTMLAASREASRAVTSGNVAILIILAAFAVAIPTFRSQAVGQSANPTANSAFSLAEATESIHERALKMGSGLVRHLAFSPDGNTLAVGTFWPDQLTLWDTRTSQNKRSIEVPAGKVYSMVFSPDGKHLVIGSDRDIFVRDTETGALSRTLEGHKAGVFALAFSPDGKTLASSGGREDKTVRLWDMRTGELQRTLEGHTDEVLGLSFTSDGDTIVSAGGIYDRTVRLWDVRSGRQTRTLQSLGTQPQNFVGAGLDTAFSPDGKILAAARGDRILLWNAHTGEQLQNMAWSEDPERELQDQLIQRLAWSADGRFVAGAKGRSAGAQVVLWDTLSGERKRTLHTKPQTADSPGPAPVAPVALANSVMSLAFSPNGKQLAVGLGDGTVTIWSLDK